MLVMLRMNREFMEYMRVSYADTPLSEFRAVDTYVALMEVSRLLRTMRTMSRSLR
jgi:hypothetical protein